jgi:hypothetical protein
MIVVDIGCQPQDSEESIFKLCEAYRPSILFGFDPHPDLVPGVEMHEYGRERPGRRSHSARQGRAGPTMIVRSRLAAWTTDGFVSYREDGIRSGVVPIEESAGVVPCFDLVSWLKTLPMPDVDVIVKMDAEGSEYPLCWAIHHHGLDLLIKEMLIEYHPGETANGMFNTERAPLRCHVQDWDLHW